MFIRASTQIDKKTNRPYTTHRLVESYRNQNGNARQRTLLNLGVHFEFDKNDWKLLADRVEEICSAQESLFGLDPVLEKEAHRIAQLVIQKHASLQQAVEKVKNKQDSLHASDFQTVDLNSLQHQNIRKAGNEHVALHAATQLQLPLILKEQGFNDKQTNTALATIIARLIRPGSELSTHRYLTEQSALDELLDADFSTLPIKNLYQISDKLLSHKEAIEKTLFQHEKDLFELEEVVTLYDLTNTYFEGRSLSNSKAAKGRSKEKRSDCDLVTLGLVLDAAGFPKRSNILPGNINEAGTLSDMLNALGAPEKATVIMDAGIATEANIDWLRENGYQYIVVSRKRARAFPEEASSIIVKDTPGNKVRTVLIKNEETNEIELLCHSEAKAGKAEAFISKANARYQEELEKLNAGFKKKGSIKKYEKVLEKLGRLKEKHRKVAKDHEVFLECDKANETVLSIKWHKKDEAQTTKGVYCLRSNRTDMDEKTLWKTYTMLTDIEAAFRSLKTELGLRPIYHQKEKRIDGHLFISLLAYHLLHTIRYQLKQKNIHASWETIRDILSTQCRITSSMKLENGKVVQIRKTSSPDARQITIYQALGIATHPGRTQKAIM